MSARRVVYLEFLRQLCRYGYSVDVEEAKKDPEEYIKKIADKVDRDLAKKIVALLGAKAVTTFFFLMPTEENIAEVKDALKFLEKTFELRKRI
ncbi:hypothetical protein DRN38_00020 [Thermococci archaeon]|nr:MAG: hypothetical protein DRN38_00020 [Thermococci archaeon]